MAKQFMMAADGRVFSTEYPQYHADCTRLQKTQGERLYREQYRADLLTRIKPGTRIYTSLRHVSGSGMSRSISLHYVTADGQIGDLTYAASVLTGYKVDDRRGGLKMSGCGMDMGWQAVYQLGRALWPQGTPEPHGTRNGEPDSDGGYALGHSWL